MPGRLTRDTVRTTIILMLRLATQGLSLIAVTRWMGPEQYGSYVSAASLAVVLSLIPNLGSGYVLMASEARLPGSGTAVFRYGWALSVALGLVLATLFPWLCAFVTQTHMSWTERYLIGATELLCTPLVLLLSGALQAKSHVATGQVVQWAPLLVRTTLNIYFMYAVPHGHLIGYVVGQAAAAAIGLGASIALASRVITIHWRPRLPTKREFQDGATFAAMHAISANPTELDKSLASRLVGDHAAGIYSATSRILSAVVIPVIGMLLAAQQRLFNYGARPDADGSRLIRLLAILAASWGLLGGCALALCAPLLPSLLGSPYTQAATVMPWVALAAPFLALRLTAGTILVSLGHPMQRVVFELAGTCILLGALAAGAAVRQLEGMALGMTVAEASMAMMGWWMVRRAPHVRRHPNH